MLNNEEIALLGLASKYKYNKWTDKPKHEIRNFATKAAGRWCNFKLDYSTGTNYYCNECAFCYKSGEKKLKKILPATILWENEMYCNPNLFKTPITISRYCDPLKSQYILDSISATKFILESGGMVSFISPTTKIPDELFELAEKHGEKFQYQIRVFSSDSSTGKYARKEFCKLFPDLLNHVKNIERFNAIGTKIIVKIDPIIIGINDTMINDIIDFFKEYNIKNFIFRQLFATNYFKWRLSKISKLYSNLLTEGSHGYKTYKAEIFFDYMSNIILRNDDVSITFCQNIHMNKILGSHKNCCQFDACDIIYNPEWSDCDANINGKLKKDDLFLKVG